MAKDNLNKSLKPLSQSNIVVTGGSRDIGGGIVKELASAGAKVMAIYRSHGERAQRLSEEIKKAGGTEPILLQADLTSKDGQDTVFKSWEEKFGNEIDVLVLCASGATLEINVDANMALVERYLTLRKQQKKTGDKQTSGTIIFLQSEPGHYHRVIDGVFDFLEYYRTKVGPAKRAGEDAFRARYKEMEEVGVRGIVVCPPEVTDTFNMKLFELQNKEAREKSRELSAMLGTHSFVTIAEVAKQVKEIFEDPSYQNQDIKLFGDSIDGLNMMGRIYGDEAVYVHTFERTGDSTGTGRLIVNPSLWKRDQEPSFDGKVVSQSDNEVKTDLKVKNEHMKGHFRPDIAAVFPGHKSVRTAARALGHVLGGKTVLRKYASVKFRSTVSEGQVLKTTVTITDKTDKTASGNALQAINGTETMDIRGMVVELAEKQTESVLNLDQLIEAGAQTVGMLVLEKLKGEDVLPLFHSTGTAEILQTINAGENLLLQTENARVITKGAMNIFSADVKVYKGKADVNETEGKKSLEIKQGEQVAVIQGLQGLLLPREEVLKKLQG